MTALVCQLTYPKIEDLPKDGKSAKVLLQAFAGQSGQLTMLLQYNLQLICGKKFAKDVQNTLQSLALAKQKHLELLGKAMLQLGVQPTYRTYPNETEFCTQNVCYATNAKQMIFADLVGETDCLATYQKMLFVLKNNDVLNLVERLIKDQQLQIDTLKRIWKNL